MCKRRLELMQRRQVLLLKISAQRKQLCELETRWQPALQLADQTVLAMRFMRRHPVLLAGLAGLAVLRRHSLLGLARNVGRAWRTWRLVNEFSKKITLQS